MWRASNVTSMRVICYWLSIWYLPISVLLALFMSTQGDEDVCRQQAQSSFHLWRLGSARGSRKCLEQCCSDRTCHVALQVKSHCYAITCVRKDLCQLVFEQLLQFQGHRIDRRNADERPAVIDALGKNVTSGRKNVSDKTVKEKSATKDLPTVPISSHDYGNATTHQDPLWADLRVLAEQHVETTSPYQWIAKLNAPTYVEEINARPVPVILKRSVDDDTDDMEDQRNDNEDEEEEDSTDEDFHVKRRKRPRKRHKVVKDLKKQQPTFCLRGDKMTESVLPARKKNYVFKRLHPRKQSLSSCSRACCSKEDCILSFMVMNSCIGVLCTGDGNCHTRRESLPRLDIHVGLGQGRTGADRGPRHEHRNLHKEEENEEERLSAKHMTENAPRRKRNKKQRKANKRSKEANTKQKGAKQQKKRHAKHSSLRERHRNEDTDGVQIKAKKVRKTEKQREKVKENVSHTNSKKRIEKHRKRKKRKKSRARKKHTLPVLEESGSGMGSGEDLTGHTGQGRRRLVSSKGSRIIKHKHTKEGKELDRETKTERHKIVKEKQESRGQTSFYSSHDKRRNDFISESRGIVERPQDQTLERDPQSALLSRKGEKRAHRHNALKRGAVHFHPESARREGDEVFLASDAQDSAGLPRYDSDRRQEVRGRKLGNVRDYVEYHRRLPDVFDQRSREAEDYDRGVHIQDRAKEGLEGKIEILDGHATRSHLVRDLDKEEDGRIYRHHIRHYVDEGDDRPLYSSSILSGRHHRPLPTQSLPHTSPGHQYISRSSYQNEYNRRDKLELTVQSESTVPTSNKLLLDGQTVNSDEYKDDVSHLKQNSNTDIADKTLFDDEKLGKEKPYLIEEATTERIDPSERMQPNMASSNPRLDETGDNTDGDEELTEKHKITNEEAHDDRDLHSRNLGAEHKNLETVERPLDEKELDQTHEDKGDLAPSIGRMGEEESIAFPSRGEVKSGIEDPEYADMGVVNDGGKSTESNVRHLGTEDSMLSKDSNGPLDPIDRKYGNTLESEYGSGALDPKKYLSPLTGHSSDISSNIQDRSRIDKLGESRMSEKSRMDGRVHENRLMELDTESSQNSDRDLIRGPYSNESPEYKEADQEPWDRKQEKQKEKKGISMIKALSSLDMSQGGIKGDKDTGRLDSKLKEQMPAEKEGEKNGKITKDKIEGAEEEIREDEDDENRVESKKRGGSSLMDKNAGEKVSDSVIVDEKDDKTVYKRTEIEDGEEHRSRKHRKTKKKKPVSEEGNEDQDDESSTASNDEDHSGSSLKKEQETKPKKHHGKKGKELNTKPHELNMEQQDDKEIKKIQDLEFKLMQRVVKEKLSGKSSSEIKKDEKMLLSLKKLEEQFKERSQAIKKRRKFSHFVNFIRRMHALKTKKRVNGKKLFQLYKWYLKKLEEKKKKLSHKKGKKRQKEHKKNRKRKSKLEEIKAEVDMLENKVSKERSRDHNHHADHSNSEDRFEKDFIEYPSQEDKDKYSMRAKEHLSKDGDIKVFVSDRTSSKHHHSRHKHHRPHKKTSIVKHDDTELEKKHASNTSQRYGHKEDIFTEVESMRKLGVEVNGSSQQSNIENKTAAIPLGAMTPPPPSPPASSLISMNLTNIRPILSLSNHTKSMANVTKNVTVSPSKMVEPLTVSNSSKKTEPYKISTGLADNATDSTKSMPSFNTTLNSASAENQNKLSHGRNDSNHVLREDAKNTSVLHTSDVKTKTNQTSSFNATNPNPTNQIGVKPQVKKGGATQKPEPTVKITTVAVDGVTHAAKHPTTATTPKPTRNLHDRKVVKTTLSQKGHGNSKAHKMFSEHKIPITSQPATTISKKKHTKSLSPTKAFEGTNQTKASKRTKPTKASKRTKPTKASKRTRSTKASRRTRPTKASEVTKPIKASKRTKPTKASKKTKPTERKKRRKKQPTKIPTINIMTGDEDLKPYPPLTSPTPAKPTHRKGHDKNSHAKNKDQAKKKEGKAQKESMGQRQEQERQKNQKEMEGRGNEAEREDKQRKIKYLTYTVKPYQRPTAAANHPTLRSTTAMKRKEHATKSPEESILSKILPFMGSNTDHQSATSGILGDLQIPVQTGLTDLLHSWIPHQNQDKNKNQLQISGGPQQEPLQQFLNHVPFLRGLGLPFPTTPVHRLPQKIPTTPRFKTTASTTMPSILRGAHKFQFTTPLFTVHSPTEGYKRPPTQGRPFKLHSKQGHSVGPIAGKHGRPTPHINHPKPTTPSLFDFFKPATAPHRKPGRPLQVTPPVARGGIMPAKANIQQHKKIAPGLTINQNNKKPLSQLHKKPATLGATGEKREGPQKPLHPSQGKNTISQILGSQNGPPVKPPQAVHHPQSIQDKLNNFFNHAGAGNARPNPVTKPRFPPAARPRPKVVPNKPAVAHQPTKPPAKVCAVERTLSQVVFIHGKDAGDYTRIDGLPQLDACIHKCCEKPDCDVALKKAENCYLVHCHNQDSCKTGPSDDPFLITKIAFLNKPRKEVSAPVPTADGSCLAEMAVGIKWTKTKRIESALRSCPRDAKGVAKRRCDPHGHWMPPDFSGCSSDDYRQLKEEVQKLGFTIGIKEVSSRLQDITTQTIDNSLIFGGDLILATSIMDALANFAFKSHVEKIAYKDLKNFVSSASNLLDETNRQEWNNVKDRLKGPGHIMQALEKFGIYAATQLPTAEALMPVVTNNLVLSVSRLHPLTHVTRYTFPNYSHPFLRTWTTKRDEIILPESLFRTGVVQVASMNYKTLSQLLPHRWNTTNHVTFTDGFRVNSKVIASTLHPKPAHKIKPPVTIILHHLKPLTTGRTKCVFWDFNQNPANGGSWSTEGCWVMTSNASTTICQCDHLTHFAVLTHLTEDKVSAKEQAKEHAIAMIWLGVPIIIILGVGAMYTCFAWSKAPRRRHVVFMDHKPRLPDNEEVVTKTVKENFPGSPNKYLYAANRTPSPSELEWEHAWDFLTNCNFEDWKKKQSTSHSLSGTLGSAHRSMESKRRCKNSKDSLQTSEYFSEGSGDSSFLRWKHQDDFEWSKERIRCLGQGLMDISHEVSQPKDSLDEIFQTLTNRSIREKERNKDKEKEKDGNSFESFSPDAISSPQSGQYTETKFGCLFGNSTSKEIEHYLKLAFAPEIDLGEDIDRRQPFINRPGGKVGFTKSSFSAFVSCSDWQVSSSFNTESRGCENLESGFFETSNRSSNDTTVKSDVALSNVEITNTENDRVKENHSLVEHDQLLTFVDNFNALSNSNFHRQDMEIDYVESIRTLFNIEDHKECISSTRKSNAVADESLLPSVVDRGCSLSESCQIVSDKNLYKNKMIKPLNQCETEQSDCTDVDEEQVSSQRAGSKHGYAKSANFSTLCLSITSNSVCTESNNSISERSLGASRIPFPRATSVKFHTKLKPTTLKSYTDCKATASPVPILRRSKNKPRTENSTAKKTLSTKPLPISSRKIKRTSLPRAMSLPKRTALGARKPKEKLPPRIGSTSTSVHRSPSKHMQSYIALRQQCKLRDSEVESPGCSMDPLSTRRKKCKSSSSFNSSKVSSSSPSRIIDMRTIVSERKGPSGVKTVRWRNAFQEERSTNVIKPRIAPRLLKRVRIGVHKDELRKSAEKRIFGATLRRWEGRSKLHCRAERDDKDQPINGSTPDPS